MGLCLKFTFGGGVLVINNCSQAWIDANLRILSEDGYILGNAAPGGQSLDAIYWGGDYVREVWKVPDNCRVTITCDGEGGISIDVCESYLGLVFGYKLVVFPPGAALPDRQWPPNNW